MLSDIKSELHRMLEFLEDKVFSQLVYEPMHENNILNLIIVSQDHLINNVAVGEHLGPCNHKLICGNVDTVIHVVENKTLVPNFRRGNFAILKISDAQYHIYSYQIQLKLM